MGKANWKPAQWQAYCVQGDIKERLKEVPSQFYKRVRQHCITYWKIKEGK